MALAVPDPHPASRLTARPEPGGPRQSGTPHGAEPKRGIAGAIERYRALTALGFPAQYPLAQFPNPPLVLALLASVVGWFVSGDAQSYVTAIGIVGITVWAWQEAVAGVNLFRHALGVVVLVNTVVGLVDRFG